MSLRTGVRKFGNTRVAIGRGRVGEHVAEAPVENTVFSLQGAEHPYRVLVETINEGAATLDADGVVLYSNSRFAEIMGVSVKKFIGSRVQGYLSDGEREKLEILIREGYENSVSGEIGLYGPGGNRRLIRFSLSPVKSEKIRTICVVATDVTKLAEVNDALQANEEALRQLSARLLQLQDDERRRIARDLHDVTGQKLAFQAIVLSQILSRTSPPVDEITNRAVSECLTLTRQAGEEIRTLSYLLHPPLLDELGLSSALEWYAQGFESRTGIRVAVDIQTEFPRLPPDVEMTLFRIVQESLTNVHRYSGSSTAEILVRYSSKQVKVEIKDSGKGVGAAAGKSQPGTVASLGVGIQGMRERMRQLSGRLEITSKPNEGTVVTAILPASALQIDAGDSTSTGKEKLQSGPLEEAEIFAAASAADKRILIADDHEVLRRGVRLMLQSEPGWKVCGEAIDGKDAVAKAIELNPDLVILDINMPSLNGLAAVRQIVRSRPNTKILVFSVHESDQTVREVLAAGAQGYLSKSKGGQDLVQVVRTILSGKNYFPAVATTIGS